jgi:hypothetical protein
MAIGKIFNTTWNRRDGQMLPKTEDVDLSDGAVLLDAVLLYAGVG